MTLRLQAENVTFAYVAGRPVLRDVSLSIEAAEVLFILGANGSGKTTLLECLAGLRRPNRGTVFVDGNPIGRLPIVERARRVALVPQIHEPVFDYTVEDVVMMGRSAHLGLFGRPSNLDRQVVLDALAAVGLGGASRRIYTAISGGERQLTLIARGLAQGAACLLMDEPGAHLDPAHQTDVFRAVSEMAGDGLAFVVTSHHPNNALLHSDRAVILNEGMLEAQGPAQEILTVDALRATYGIEFSRIVGRDGSVAILPRVVRNEET